MHISNSSTCPWHIPNSQVPKHRVMTMFSSPGSLWNRRSKKPNPCESDCWVELPYSRCMDLSFAKSSVSNKIHPKQVWHQPENRLEPSWLESQFLNFTIFFCKTRRFFLLVSIVNCQQNTCNICFREEIWVEYIHKPTMQHRVMEDSWNGGTSLQVI